MARRKNGEPPRYRLHNQSGQAVVSLPRGGGKYRDVLLGPYDTPESRSEYLRVLAEWDAGKSFPKTVAGITVAELCLAYVKHAEAYYRDEDGDPTGELWPVKMALRPLNFLYGEKPAAEFGPLGLKAVRELMVNGYEHSEYGTQGSLSRKVINKRVRRIQAMFKWAVSEELVPPSVHQAVAAVTGLRMGKTSAKEREAVKPVAWESVEKTLPCLNPVTRAMVLVQWHTGMRPGEVCQMRLEDLDRSEAVWVYRPGRHKTRHHGHGRSIPIGPKARAVLAPFIREDQPQRFLFSPAEGEALRKAERRAARKSKVQPSQQNRGKSKPKRKPGDCYETGPYSKAVRYACRKAGVPHWHPHQLRHAFGTEVRKKFGVEASQTALGHRQMAATEIYAEKNLALAAQVAKSIG